MMRFLLSLIRKLQRNAKERFDHAKLPLDDSDLRQAIWDGDIDLINEYFSQDATVTAVFTTPSGDYLVQIFPDGQARLAQRSERHDSWTPGFWTIATGYNHQDEPS
jgi:hypothetical protein